jgi:O-antigen ligase
VGYRQFVRYSEAELGIPLNAHNENLRIAAESGVIALVLVLVLVGRAFLVWGRPLDRGVQAALVASVTGLAFANAMTDLRVSLPVWILLGLAWAARDRAAGPATTSTSGTVTQPECRPPRLRAP